MTKSNFDPEKHLEEILKMEEIGQNPEFIGEPEGETILEETEMIFDLLPEELEDYLNKYVVNQESAIEILATKVCTHFNRMKLEKELTEEEKLVGNIKSNMLLIGPTGVGKTYIIKLIAKKLGVPFVKADATKFSETGYVGGDVEDLVRELVHESNGDIKKAEYGIVYIDEIDKIASSGNTNGPDVSRTGVQRNLLKLMEEAEIDLKTPHDLASQVEAAMEAQKTGKVTRQKINTKNILFIVSGAFGNLDEIINKRQNKQSIGFAKEKLSKKDKKDILKKLKTEDLIEFGFETEFIGRLPVTVILNHLDEDGLYKILKNKHSTVILGKKLDFRAYGIKLNFTDEALKILAQRAFQEKTGARGLLSVFENVLIKFEKKLPSTEIKELVLTKEIIENPAPIIEKMLLEDSIKNFQKDFLAEHGIFLEFESDAVNKINEISKKEKISIMKFCENSFHDYFHGIRLMKLDSFTITKEAAEDPENYLNDYIKNNYHNK